MVEQESADFDARVRSEVYSHFVEETVAPSRVELAAALGSSPEEIAASFERLADGKALVLQPESREILMAEPFSAVPTPFVVEGVVEAGCRRWWGNCIWDALGISAALHLDARVVTSCADCGDAMTLEVVDGRLVSRDGIVHFSVPVKDWWLDVTFT